MSARPFTALADAPAPAGPPSALAGLAEARAAVQVPRLLLASPSLRRAPRAPEPGRVVIDVPGWLASDVTGLALRLFLRRLGWDARGWGFGTNRGDPMADATRLLGQVERVATEHGPVALVGWSLGGVIAREVARRRPDLVTRVITYGTPVVGGPTYTVGARVYGAETSARVEELSARIERDDPLRVPVTALFSRRDGIVAWESCLDRTSGDVEHLEVGSTHLGMGLDPDVWRVVADRLARPGGAGAGGSAGGSGRRQ